MTLLDYRISIARDKDEEEEYKELEEHDDLFDSKFQKLHRDMIKDSDDDEL